MRKLHLFILLTLFVALGCGLWSGSESTEEPQPPPATEASANLPGTPLSPGATDTPERPPQRQEPCGDGVCDGPENAKNCPEDCGAGSVSGTGSSDLCSNPNPHHAVLSEEIEIWHDWLEDGSFEAGTANFEFKGPLTGKPGRGERSQSAARTGSWGYTIITGSGESAIFSMKAYTEKGDEIQFSFWARSLSGPVTLQPVLYGMGRSNNYRPEEFSRSDSPTTIGTDWTQVSLQAFLKQYESAQLSLEVGPDANIQLDDFKAEQHIFQMPTYSEGTSRMVGGIPVPLEPAAPVHFTVLMHIEDPAIVFEDEEAFWQNSARMSELARVIHEHGGLLTIQPEEDWPMASEIWHPGLLAELARDYGVVYSTHTHGPHCRDDQGRLRSYSDCQINQDTPGWDQTITDYENPWVIEYVTSLRDLLEKESGTKVTDHNGNWGFAAANDFAEIPMLTRSAYKDFHTQATYDMLINNPWRPMQVDADRQIDQFLTHDPNANIIYIPGYGQNVARYQDRLSVRVPPILGQFIRFADPERVNTLYLVTHVGSFEPRDGIESDSYISLNQANGNLTFSDNFAQDLQYWDDLLSQVIDPLVAAGYLQWTSLPEMGELFREWENNCALP
jgi:hypothetical protein